MLDVARLYCDSCKTWRDKNTFYPSKESSRVRDVCKVCKPENRVNYTCEKKEEFGDRIRCLKCDREFVSAGNRICNRCKKSKFFK